VLNINLALVVGTWQRSLIAFRDALFSHRQDKKEPSWLAHLHVVFLQMLSQYQEMIKTRAL